ncbi:DnaT-like ssDNA-binding protein [Castellaniella defragrans]|uniref:DnaT-like ssDNA-binding protein n=1 Tax=Castellaniella defragrans TaxID=75697 RepID=UPI0005B7B859|nr:DnaT-like ssDNA-binding protein [Castellaniella defragrans]
MALDTDISSPSMESYVSVDDADQYHTAFGHADWAQANTTEKEAALRRATQYLDARYTFKGEPDQPQQPLAWPRRGHPWPERRVAAATCELALRALSNPLLSDVAPLGVRQETIGPLTTVYSEGSGDGQIRYAVVDDLLRGLIAGGITTRLERA